MAKQLIAQHSLWGGWDSAALPADVCAEGLASSSLSSSSEADPRPPFLTALLGELSEERDTPNLEEKKQFCLKTPNRPNVPQYIWATLHTSIWIWFVLHSWFLFRPKCLPLPRSRRTAGFALYNTPQKLQHWPAGTQSTLLKQNIKREYLMECFSGARHLHYDHLHLY